MAELAGRHALITGGGGGIGAAIADALAAQGARLTLIGRDAERVVGKAAQLPLARGIAADVGDRLQLAAALTQAVEEFGPVSILINNAGVSVAQAFLEIDAASFQTAIDVNLAAALVAAQMVLPSMLASGWGRIVNIASTAGLVGYKGVASYVAAKHGLIGLTRAMATEFARSGVTVNAVCPGYCETDMAQQAIANIRAKSGRSEVEAHALLAARNPQGRLVSPSEVAASVLWLCADDSRSITGQSIAVCGGEVMN